MRSKASLTPFVLSALYLPTLVYVSAGTLSQCMSSLTLSPNSIKERDDGYLIDMRFGGGNPCLAGMSLELTIPSLPGAECQTMYFGSDGPFPADQTFYCYPPYDYQSGGYTARFVKNSPFNLVGRLSDDSSATPVTKNFPLTVRKSDLQVRLEACAASLKLGDVKNANDGFTYRYTHGTSPNCADFSIQPTDPTGVIQCNQQSLYADPTQEYEQTCYYTPVQDNFSIDLQIKVVYSKDLTVSKGTQTFKPTGETPAINAIRCAKGLVYEASGPIGNDGIAKIKVTKIPEECRSSSDYLYLTLYTGQSDYQYCDTHTFLDEGDLIIACSGRDETGSSAPFDTNGVTLPIRGYVVPNNNYYSASAPVADRTLTWTSSVFKVCQDSFEVGNFALTSTTATSFDLVITELSASCDGYQFHSGSSTDANLYCNYVGFAPGSSSYTTSCQYSGGSAAITLTPSIYLSSSGDFPFDESFTVAASSNGANCASTISIDQYYNQPRFYGDYPQANDLVTIFLGFDPSQCNGVSVTLFDAGGLTCPTIVFESGTGYVALLCNVNGQAPGAYTTHPKLDGVEHPEVDLSFNTHLDPFACGQSIVFTSIGAAEYSYTFYASDTTPFAIKIDYRGDYCDSSFAFSPILQDFTTPDQSTKKRTVTYDCGELSGSAAGSAQYTCGIAQGAMPTGDWGTQLTPCPSNMDQGDCYYASTGFSVANLDSTASPPSTKRKREEDQVVIGGAMGSSRRCNVGLTACPVAGRALLWECVDTFGSIDTCGGCWNTREGIDCSELAGVEDIACMAGVCVASTCTDDYTLAANQTCILV